MTVPFHDAPLAVPLFLGGVVYVLGLVVTGAVGRDDVRRFQAVVTHRAA